MSIYKIMNNLLQVLSGGCFNPKISYGHSRSFTLEYPCGGSCFFKNSWNKRSLQQQTSIKQVSFFHILCI